MDYYKELLEQIDEALRSGDELGAFALVRSELKLPYIPKEIEEKLRSINDELELKLRKDNSALNSEQIAAYLKMDEEHQLLAVNELDHHNLRDEIELVNEYLMSDGFDNAKVLLVELLVKQALSDEITMKKDGIEYNFIPRYVLLPEESDGFMSAKEFLEDVFLHDPSYLKIATDLLYKECIMELPINYEEEEGKLLGDKIVRFILNSFADEDKLREYTAKYKAI